MELKYNDICVEDMIVYEDNHLLVVTKPYNIPVQADESEDVDFQNLLKEYLKSKHNKQGEAFLGIVHRLDRPTGGLMVFAKTSKCASRLSEQIRNQEFTKSYLVVTENCPAIKNNILVNYLKKDPKLNKVSIVPMFESEAKRAELLYKVLESDRENNMTLMKVTIFTGRSHQIRIQLANIGCPLIPDKKYGSKSKTKCNLALWAYQLQFEHPTKDQTMKFYSLPDQDAEPWKHFTLSKHIK